MPAIMQAVIMMVNGNIGTGVAVLGAFSLVRFRSVPGNSKEICCIFLAMAVGIATGIGQLYFAGAFTVAMALIFILLKSFNFGGLTSRKSRSLRITVPEDCDYEKEIDPLLNEFCSFYAIEKIKTTNMGSLFTLTYRITLHKNRSDKSLIDNIRIKNANLPIIMNAYIKTRDDL